MRAIAVATVGAIWAVLIGCTSEPRPSAVVDNSFRTIDQPLPGPTGPGRLVAYVKAQPNNGFLAVCGVFLFDDGGSGDTRVLDELANDASYIQVDDSPLRVGTRFFPRYPAPLIGRALTEVRPPAATCETTAAPWRQEFASAPLILHLVPTAAAPRQLRIPSPRG